MNKIKADKSEDVKYDYLDYPIYIRRDILSNFPNYTADSHWHDDIELILVLSGKMYYNVNGEIILIEEGEGILVNSKQFHYGFSKDKTECDFICILFHPVLLCHTNTFEKEYVTPVIANGRSFYHLSQNVSWQNNIMKYTGEIFEKRNESTSMLIIQGLICQLWNELITNIDAKNETYKNTSSKLITLKKMLAYIHENYKSKISLTDIATAGHVSKRTCGSIFLEYQNKTPIEFLVDYRLRKSIELMKETDMNIMEISLAVGFSGASYYAETFKKCFGETPMEHRRKLKK